MTYKEDKPFIIVTIVVLSFIYPWTIQIWIILGLLFGILLYLAAVLLEKSEEKKKKRKIPTAKDVPNEDFENALRDWNKNRRRGTQRKD